MQPAPIELEHYVLTVLRIEDTSDMVLTTSRAHKGADIGNCQIQAAIDIGEPPKEKGKKQNHFAVRIRISIEPREGRDFPYQIEVGLQGFFTVHVAKNELDGRNLVAVNGSGMLYSVIREIVLAQTVRFSHGPVMLPSVHFLDLIRKETASVDEGAGLVAKKQTRRKSNAKLS